MTNQKSPWAIALMVAIVAVIVGGGVYLWQAQNSTSTGDRGDYISEEEQQKIQDIIDADQRDQQADESGLTPGEEEEPLTYSTTGVNASVSIKTEPFEYTAELASRTEGCGNNQSERYFADLVSTFDGTTKTIYSFEYQGDSQGSNTLVVTLLPNNAGYASLDEFKKDFDVCDAGGSFYPHQVNENWLLFLNSCGTGYADESGRPNGCQEVMNVVEPTLELS